MVQIVQGELAGLPRRVAHLVGMALDAAFPVLAKERVGVFDQEAKADRAHLVLELELHVQPDGVAAEDDVVRRLLSARVAEDQPKAELPGVEVDGPPDVAGAHDRVRFLEHRGSPAST